MVKWEAIGPISVMLEYNTYSLSHGDFSLSRYDEQQLDELLKNDSEYWSPVSLSTSYKSGYWLKLSLEVDADEEPWKKAVDQVRLYLETMGLFKSTLSILAVAGLCVRRIEEAAGPSGHFGWENTIIGKPYYYLKTSEHADLFDLLTKYKEFWDTNKIGATSSKQLKRINLARYYFGKNFQTVDIVERYIFLSIALEALYGEAQDELRYRYANRAALLLGDDVETRKIVYKNIQKAYDKRSDILHGRISWRIEPKEVLTYTEIIRQTILRFISLQSRGYVDICRILDECILDSTRHARLLEDAKTFFGKISEYRCTEELYKHHGWAIRK